MGVTTAPVVGSGSWPAWMARVARAVALRASVLVEMVMMGTPWKYRMVWVVRMMGIGFKGAIGLPDSRLTVFYRYCSARLGLVVRSTTSANPLARIQSSLKIFSM